MVQALAAHAVLWQRFLLAVTNIAAHMLLVAALVGVWALAARALSRSDSG